MLHSAYEKQVLSYAWIAVSAAAGDAAARQVGFCFVCETGEDDGEGQLRLYQDLEKKMPARAVQTYFRANYRNHINLSAIADNKANIMISVNTILISVLITFLSYRNIGQTQPIILMPVIIFLVTGLASLIFAVLSARPKVTNFYRKISKNVTNMGA